MMLAFKIFLIAFFTHTSYQLNNGLGRTPQMGWSSWYAYQCQPNETLIQLTTDIIVVTGLAAVGYEYVNLDDCWQVSRIDDIIQADSRNFPSGMRALGDYIHSKNLKFGLSSDAGMKTCDNRPGSLHFEKQDANTYASWGVDYLYYENCFDDGTKPEARFPPMRDALNATGRPIFLAIREWGSDNPFVWEVNVANSWRTTQGRPDTWNSILYDIDIVR
jgi:alpha-galactosidase